MPYDSSGNFTLVPGTIVSDGMTIQPSQHNPPFQDVAGGLSMVFVRDGRAPMTGPVNMNGNKVIGAADGTSDSDLATVGQAASLVGDFKDSARNLGSKWLRRDGSVYSSASYPDLSPLMESVDGTVQYTSKSSGVSVTIYDVVVALGKIVAVGAGGTIISSSDGGETWSSVSSGTSEDIFSIIYSNTIFVATLGNGSIITSSSAESGSWTIRTTGSSLPCRSVAYGSGTWVIVGGGTGSPNGYIYSSNDLVTWTDRTPSAMPRRLSVRFGSGTFVVSGNDSTIQRSSTGTSFSSVTVSGPSELPYLSFANGVFFSGSGGSTIYRSNDAGATWGAGITSPVSIRRISFGNGVYLSAGPSGASARSIDGNLFTTQTTGVSASLEIAQWDENKQGWWMVGSAGTILFAKQLSSSLFKVPSDNPTYGWVRARP